MKTNLLIIAASSKDLFRKNKVEKVTHPLIFANMKSDSVTASVIIGEINNYTLRTTQEFVVFIILRVRRFFLPMIKP